MNLTQRLPLAGAVIISTPQHVALLDARRGAQMFKLVQVPLLGLVENMAYYACGSCGHREPLYGSSGVPAAARELEVPLLGQVGGAGGAQGGGHAT
jgi:ATP-binding protein involved in chromosome partitioning